MCFASARGFAGQAHQASESTATIGGLVDGVRSGDRIAHFLSDFDWITAALCRATGHAGRVYVVMLADETALKSNRTPTRQKESPCSNTSLVMLQHSIVPAPELYNSSDDPGAVYEYYKSKPAAENFAVPELLDAIFITERYHDLLTNAFGSPNLLRVNVALFAALKPGGVLHVMDFTAPIGSAAHQADSLHRIDPEIVKQNAIAAGFEFLAYAELRGVGRDPRQQNAHQLGGRADRFVLKFRKPENARRH